MRSRRLTKLLPSQRLDETLNQTAFTHGQQHATLDSDVHQLFDADVAVCFVASTA